MPKSSEISKKRYYDKSSPSEKQLLELRESIIKKMKVAGNANCDSSENVVGNTIQNEINVNEGHVEREFDSNHDQRPKRAPIGHLPSYIPIN